MNIILVGYMGSGKTSLGKKLAKRLNLRFIDTDNLIESRQGMTISSIFELHGEAAFRELEKELIEELAVEENLLLSTGGGMPCFNDLMVKLNELGTTIYLKRPAKELAHRIINSKKKRPITDGKSFDELVTFIDEMLKKRNAFYEQANLIVDRTIQDVSTLELLVKTYQNK